MHILLPKIDIPYIPNTNKKKYTSELLLLIKTNNANDFATWLDWHLNYIKVDHIAIYDNESPIAIERMIKKYGDKISYTKVYGTPHQADIYTDHIAHVSEAQFVLPIDDDEFIYSALDFNSYLQSTKPNKLALNEILFIPHKPIEKRHNKNIFDTCDSFVIGNIRENREVKTIVNTDCSHYYFDVKTYIDSHPSPWHDGHPDWVDIKISEDVPMEIDRGTDFNYTLAGNVHNPLSITPQGDFIWAKDMFLNDVYGFMSCQVNVPTEIFIAHMKVRSKEEWDWKCKVRKVVADMNPDYYDSQYELYDKIYAMPFS